jgi:hypothetical protein
LAGHKALGSGAAESGSTWRTTLTGLALKKRPQHPPQAPHQRPILASFRPTIAQHARRLRTPRRAFHAAVAADASRAADAADSSHTTDAADAARVPTVLGLPTPLTLSMLPSPPGLPTPLTLPELPTSPGLPMPSMLPGLPTVPRLPTLPTRATSMFTPRF